MKFFAMALVALVAATSWYDGVSTGEGCHSRWRGVLVGALIALAWIAISKA